MSKLERIIYCPLCEEDVSDFTGWSKETVSFVLNHRGKVEKQIRGIARGIRKLGLQPSDVEDIYEDLLIYLHNCDDYDIGKAIERSSTGNLVSLEGYLNTCIKYCVIRYCTQLNIHDKETIPDIVNESEDKELSIFNTIPDPSSEITLDYLVYDLRTLCKSCEPLRYRFGIDLYLVLYIRLLTVGDPSGDAWRNTLNILGISKKDISGLNKNSEDSVIVSFARAISMTPTDEAIQMIREYVYSAYLIDRVILLQMN